MSMEVVLYAYRADPAAMIARCRELAVRQVCLLLESMPGYVETGVPEPRALRAIAQTLADAGIALSAGNGSTGRNPDLLLNPSGHRRELDAQLQMLESLSGAGIGALLYYQHFPYPVDPDDAERYWDGLIANTRELVAQAQATDVRLAHHAVWRCLPATCQDHALGRQTTMEDYPRYRHDGWDGPYLLASHHDVARLIDAIPSSHNGVCFCTGMHIMGGEVPALVETFKGRIHHAQMRDVRGRWPFAEEVFLGEGEIDFSTILRLLDAAGYSGIIGPEHLGEPRWPGDDPEAAAIAFLRQHIPNEQMV
jgi:sugar phosphate isomerase/epimerase